MILNAQNSEVSNTGIKEKKNKKHRRNVNFRGLDKLQHGYLNLLYYLYEVPTANNVLCVSIIGCCSGLCLTLPQINMAKTNSVKSVIIAIKSIWRPSYTA